MLKYTLSIWLPDEISSVVYELNDNYLAGRNPPGDSIINRLFISNKFISKVHFSLILMPPDDGHHFGHYAIKDGNIFTGDRSTNGTWVNGLRIAHESEEHKNELYITNVELRHQDIITFGSTKAPKAIFEILRAEEQELDATSGFSAEIDF